MSRTIGFGGVEHIEAQAARLRHLAGELQRDLARWRDHLPAAAVDELEGRVARHLKEARKLEADAMQARWPVDGVLLCDTKSKVGGLHAPR